MGEEPKEKRICIVCLTEEVFQWWGDKQFDKCFSCAREYEDRLLKEFVAVLSPEQLALFKKYDKASSDLTSMAILD